MPIFEIEGPDGKIYEVDAPDIAAAVEGFKGFSGGGNSPDTPAAPQYDSLANFGQPQLDEAAAYHDQIMPSLSQGLNSASNAISGGFAGMAEDYIGGAVNAIIPGFNPDNKSYNELVDQIQEAKKTQRDAHPIADTIGTVGGAVGGGILGGAGLAGLAKGGNALAGAATNSVVGRTLASMLGGAGQNVGIAAGRDEIDSVGEGAGLAGMGAIFGGLGQLGAEVAVPAFKAAKRLVPGSIGQAARTDAAQHKLAASLLADHEGAGSVGAYIGGGSGARAKSILEEAAEQAGGPTNRMLAEANPKLMDVLEELSGSPATVGKTEFLEELARTRQMVARDEAPGILSENLTGAIDRSAPKANTQLFKEIFDSPQGQSVPVVDKTQLINGLTGVRTRTGNPLIDPRNRMGASNRAVTLFQKQLEDVTDQGALTLKGMQNLKIQLGDMVDFSPSQSTTDKLNAMDVAAMRDYVNDAIRQIDPRYDAVAAQFADAKSAEKLAKRGSQLMGGTDNSAPLPVVREYMDSLNEAEKLQVQRGAAQWLEGRVARNPNFLKKLAEENPDVLERVETILGDVLQQNGTDMRAVSEAIEAQLEQGARFGRIETAIKGQAKHTIGNDPEATQAIQGMFHAGRVAADAFRGMAGGGAVNSLNRAAQSLPHIQQRGLFDLLSSTNPEKATETLNELYRLLHDPRMSMRPGVVGSGIGVGIGGAVQR